MDPNPQHLQRLPVYGGGDEERLRLVRTIAAMANTGGGTIRIVAVNVDRAELEARSLMQLAGGYLAPPVRGVECSVDPDGSVSIRVPESESKPHVFTRDGLPAGDGNGAVPIFHAGQIWMRRPEGDAPADGEDVQRLVREAASDFLERISVGLRDPSFAFRLTETAGVPVHLADDEDSIPVSPNLARLYPYTTKTLARELGKPTNWVATAAKVLHLKDSRDNAYGVPSANGGRVVQWRYSSHARRELEQRLDADPDWNPYHELESPK